jgi:hypothetical protein
MSYQNPPTPGHRRVDHYWGSKAVSCRRGVLVEFRGPWNGCRLGLGTAGFMIKGSGLSPRFC